MAMRVIIYTRVSTKEQGTNRNGLEGQLAACLAFCEREGLEVAQHFEEVASGELDTEGRPLLGQAIDAARKTKALLLVAKLDRLSRHALFILTLMESTVRFATVEDGLEVSPFMLHIKAVVGERERVMIGERTKAALGALKARGVALGTHAHRDPLATRALALDRAAKANRAKADQWASTLGPTLKALAVGRTLQGVADELNRLRVPTARGGEWHPSTVCKVLKRLD